MPYADADRRREAAKERGRRYRQREHEKKYGPGAGDMRGKNPRVSGSAHYRWNHGKITNADGYVKVRVGVGHPLADPNGYAYEHLVVWCAAGRARPVDGETIHHENEDKSDNRIENLRILSRAEHNSLHIAERGRRANGQFAPNKKLAGRELDGRTWDQFPEVAP